MQVLINLVPEARLIKLKQKRNKRLLTTITVLVGVVAASIAGTLIVLIIANQAIFAVNESAIKDKKQQITDINKNNMEKSAATLQEHLASFKALNDDRLYASKIFAEFSQTIQPDITVKSFDVTDDYTVSISGTSDKDPQHVSKFVTAIDDYGTTYKKKQDSDPVDYFNAVEILTISRSGESAEGATEFTISFKASQSVFSKNNTVKK